MGFAIPEECCVKGCGALRGGASDGCELEVCDVLGSRGALRQLPPCAGAVLWACGAPHRRAAAAALLAGVAASGRRKAGERDREARATLLAEQGAALRDLLRVSAARGMPQGEMLLRLIARIAPELVPTEEEAAAAREEMRAAEAAEAMDT
jgi:hypothetical protein